MADLKNLICALGRTLEEESNVAHDLWTWLPSHAAAAEFHGSDHTHHFVPDVADIMKETAKVFSILRNPEYPRDAASIIHAFSCPCGGQDCDIDAVHPTETVEQVQLLFKKLFGVEFKVK